LSAAAALAPAAAPTAGPGAEGPDLTSANRAAPLAGMPDWSHAGYLGGQPLPGDGDMAGGSCNITPEQLASQYHVIPSDGVDDTTGLQNAIDDIKSNCSPTANYHHLSLITLPAGQLDVSRQMYVDASFLTIRGKGSGDGGTKFVFRPDINTRYDTLVNGRWDQDTMVAGSGSDEGSGGWVWPGRGMFRVQTRDVAARYQDDWAAAPANRKDLFEGSVNQHWVSGLKLSAKAGDPGFSARQGDSVVHLVSNANMSKFTVGGYVWVGAANSRNFYAQQGITGDDEALEEPLMMRQQMFQVASFDTTAKTVTLDHPLEWDLPVDDTSDGSAQYNETPTPSKITPLEIVEGVGFEDFAFTQDMTGLPMLDGSTFQGTPEQAVNNYGNMAPEYAMHGIVFKWAANSWARGLTATMTGSHPIVTEDALNLQIERNSFDGAWNKGKGGNGYLRGSRVWHSLYAYNLSRNLRHFTFQWSASDNVAFRNDLDSDLNLHGGWEHDNLFDGNTVRVSYDHRSGSCTANCGGEGGEIDDGTWYPIWWAAGPKAIKWSGSSGPQNVFYNNTMIKQTTPGGAFLPYAPYGTQPGTAFQFGSDNADPSQFHPLSQNGQLIPDWGSRETLDYSGQGVVTREMGGLPSLFLRDTGGPTITPRDLGDTPLISWNMQGAGSGTDSKWTTQVGRLARSAPIVALQEAGPSFPRPPAGTQIEAFDDFGNNIINGLRPNTPVTTLALANHGLNSEVDRLPVADAVDPSTGRHGLGDIVTHTQWANGRGDNRVLRDVYFLHTDANRVDNNNNQTRYTQGRVNLAFVTDRAADAVAAIPNPFGGVSRATLGLLFGDTWYFNLHAFSGNNGGVDAPGLLREIQSFVNGRGLNETWVAMGDYNRTPANMQAGLPEGARIYNTGQTTQQSGNELDYFINSSAVDGVQVNRLQDPTLPPGNPNRPFNSDHSPVALGALRAGAEPRDLFGSNRVLENMLNGRVLNAIATGVTMITAIRAHTSVQSWAMQQYNDGSIRFQGLVSAGLTACLLGALPRVDGSTPATAESCDNSLNERWMPEDMGNNEWQFHLLAKPDLCLQQGTDQLGNEFSGPCADLPAQRWIVTPENAPTEDAVTPVNLPSMEPGQITLESMNAGGVMDVLGKATANDSSVGQFHRKEGDGPNPNQGWNLTWLDDHRVTFQGDQSKRCLDILHSDTAESGRQLVIYDCNGQASQQWEPEQLADSDQDLVRWHNVAHPELCMDVAGAPTDPDTGNLIVFTCNTGANQVWTFTPYNPTGTPEVNHDIHDEL
jgi:hypothetical protein